MHRPHARFELRPFGRPDLEEDYRLLLTLANAQAPHDEEGNRAWQRNRIAFDEARGRRRHYIAVHKPSGEAVGYAAVEQQREHEQLCRLFLVFDPHWWMWSDLGQFLYEQLLADAHELGIHRVFLIEYASDGPFRRFLGERGFTQTWEGVQNGFQVVRLEKRLDGDALVGAG